jgi:hypothetical protein
MTEKTMELIEAALMLLPHLKASTDDLKLEPLDYLRKNATPKGETPAQRMRREADELEAKDAAILRFRAAIAAFNGDTPEELNNRELYRKIQEAVREVVRQERERDE